MLGKLCNRPMVTHASVGGLFTWGGLTLAAPLHALLLLLSFSGAAGQCTMCQGSITGDWTYWDADCGTKVGDKCLSELGDWVTWDGCCSASGTSSRQRDRKPIAGETDSHGNVFVRLDMPGLEWVTQLVHKRPDAVPLDQTAFVSLSQGQGTENGQATSVWEGARQKLCASVFSSPLAWACAAAVSLLLLNARRVTVAIGHVNAKAVWKPVAVDDSEEEMRSWLG